MSFTYKYITLQIPFLQSEEKREEKRKRKMKRAEARAVNKAEIKKAAREAADEVKKRQRDEASSKSKKVIRQSSFEYLHNCIRNSNTSLLPLNSDADRS